MDTKLKRQIEISKQRIAMKYKVSVNDSSTQLIIFSTEGDHSSQVTRELNVRGQVTEKETNTS